MKINRIWGLSLIALVAVLGSGCAVTKIYAQYDPSAGSAKLAFVETVSNDTYTNTNILKEAAEEELVAFGFSIAKPNEAGPLKFTISAVRSWWGLIGFMPVEWVEYLFQIRQNGQLAAEYPLATYYSVVFPKESNAGKYQLKKIIRRFLDQWLPPDQALLSSGR